MKRHMFGRIVITVLAVWGASWWLAITAGAQGQAPPAPPLGPEAQMHVMAAKLLSANDIRIVKYACPGQPPLSKNPVRGQDAVLAPPTKIFDQLYFLGTDFVASYALVTSGGIILLDTMDNNGEAQKIIADGLKVVGLDPAQIKYAVLSHGHGDHFGGAKYLQELYKIRILAGPRDWDMMEKAATAPPVPRPAGDTLPEFGAPPKRDMDVADGQKLTLGDTTVTLYRTPGHTPDTVSVIFPVTDRGVPHMVSWAGGTIPPNEANSIMMAQSYLRLLQMGEEAGADVYISPHPYADSAFSVIDKDISKIDKLKARKAGDPNPFVAGRDKYIRYMMAHIECSLAKASYLQGR